jgi:hypothetical protein
MSSRKSSSGKKFKMDDMKAALDEIARANAKKSSSSSISVSKVKNVVVEQVLRPRVGELKDTHLQLYEHLVYSYGASDENYYIDSADEDEEAPFKDEHEMTDFEKYKSKTKLKLTEEQAKIIRNKIVERLDKFQDISIINKDQRYKFNLELSKIMQIVGYSIDIYNMEYDNSIEPIWDAYGLHNERLELINKIKELYKVFNAFPCKSQIYYTFPLNTSFNSVFAPSVYKILGKNKQTLRDIYAKKIRDDLVTKSISNERIISNKLREYDLNLNSLHISDQFMSSTHSQSNSSDKYKGHIIRGMEFELLLNLKKYLIQTLNNFIGKNTDSMSNSKLTTVYLSLTPDQRKKLQQFFSNYFKILKCIEEYNILKTIFNGNDILFREEKNHIDVHYQCFKSIIPKQFGKYILNDILSGKTKDDAYTAYLKIVKEIRTDVIAVITMNDKTIYEVNNTLDEQYFNILRNNYISIKEVFKYIKTNLPILSKADLEKETEILNIISYTQKWLPHYKNLVMTPINICGYTIYPTINDFMKNIKQINIDLFDYVNTILNIQNELLQNRHADIFPISPSSMKTVLDNVSVLKNYLKNTKIYKLDIKSNLYTKQYILPDDTNNFHLYGKLNDLVKITELLINYIKLILKIANIRRNNTILHIEQLNFKQTGKYILYTPDQIEYFEIETLPMPSITEIEKLFDMPPTFHQFRRPEKQLIELFDMPPTFHQFRRPEKQLIELLHRVRGFRDAYINVMRDEYDASPELQAVPINFNPNLGGKKYITRL